MKKLSEIQHMAEMTKTDSTINVSLGFPRNLRGDDIKLTLLVNTFIVLGEPQPFHQKLYSKTKNGILKRKNPTLGRKWKKTI